MSWFYMEKGERQGPVEEAELLVLIADDRVAPESMLFQNGMETWRRLDALQGEGFFEPPPEPILNGKACSFCGKTFLSDELLQNAEAAACLDCKPHFVQLLKEGGLAGDQKFAGFWVRSVALLLDNLVLQIPLLILNVILSWVFNPLMESGSVLGQGLYLVLIFGLSLILPALYEILMVTRYGGTLGKLAYNIVVVDTDGEFLTIGRSTGRHFAKKINDMVFYVTYFWVGFDREKRGLHDLICNTRVVRR
jgi:uncharacterized RDD family membrane protein YckC